MGPIKVHHEGPGENDDDHTEVRVHGERLDNLDQRVDEHGKRIESIEKEHVATLKRDVQDLKVWQGRVLGAVSVLLCALSLFGKRIVDYFFGHHK